VTLTELVVTSSKEGIGSICVKLRQCKDDLSQASVVYLFPACGLNISIYYVILLNL